MGQPGWWLPAARLEASGASDSFQNARSLSATRDDAIVKIQYAQRRKRVIEDRDFVNVAVEGAINIIGVAADASGVAP
jgi:hypothetical protein